MYVQTSILSQVASRLREKKAGLENRWDPVRAGQGQERGWEQGE